MTRDSLERHVAAACRQPGSAWITVGLYHFEHDAEADVTELLDELQRAAGRWRDERE